MKITWDSLEEDAQDADNHVEGNQVEVEDNHMEGNQVVVEDNYELEVVVHSHKGARMMDEVDTRLWEEQADLYVTSAEWGALPSLVEVRIYHLFYPFLTCVVPVIVHDEISILCIQTNYGN